MTDMEEKMKENCGTCARANRDGSYCPKMGTKIYEHDLHSSVKCIWYIRRDGKCR